MTLIRAALFNLLFYLWTASLAVLGLPVLIMPRRAVVWLSGFWADGAAILLRATVGLDYEVRGRANLPAGASIVAFKHQSAWETIMLGSLFDDPAIVLKRSLTFIPLFGWYLRKDRAIAIDRKAGIKALKPMIEAARQAAGEARPVIIFPEGTRTPVGQRQPYQPGVAALYLQLGVPLVPVAINSGLFWGRRAFLKRPGRIIVEILPPILPGLDRRRVMAELEDRIETATECLTGCPARPVQKEASASPVDKSVESRPEKP
jgi:1-acyl-sn-glycerol-3-phosphate acyltransferase